MSIGLVMFLKSLLLMAVAGVWDVWLAFKARHVERGLPLRQNRKTGVYEAHNWPELWQRRAVLALKVVAVPVVLLHVAVAYWVVTAGAG